MDTSFEAWLEQVKSHLVAKGAVIDLATVPFADLDYAYRSGSSPVVFAKSLIAKAPQVPAAPSVQPQAVPPVSYYQAQPQPQQSAGIGHPNIVAAVLIIGLLLVLILSAVFVVGSCALDSGPGVHVDWKNADDRKDAPLAPVKVGMTRAEVERLIGKPIRDLQRIEMAFPPDKKATSMVSVEYKDWIINYEDDRVFMAFSKGYYWP